MSMSSSRLLTLALVLLAILITTQVQADVPASSAKANIPSGSGTYQVKLGENGTWTDVNSTTPAADIGKGSVSYRIKDDDESFVSYKYNVTDNIPSWTADTDSGFEVAVTVNTTYGSSALASTPAVTQKLLILNYGCSGRYNFTAHMYNKNGTVVRKTWIQHLHLDVPEGTERIAIDQFNVGAGGVGNGSTAEVIYGTKPLDYEFGKGRNVPTVSMLSSATLKYCTEDD